LVVYFLRKEIEDRVAVPAIEFINGHGSTY
jgi:hypothetical protein